MAFAVVFLGAMVSATVFSIMWACHPEVSVPPV
jgi:hypothetical protein